MKNDFTQFITEIAVNNKIDKPLDIKELLGGQIHHVFSINDKYVVKIEGELSDMKGVFDQQSELMDRLLSLGAKVPKIFDCGQVNGKGYILMERVKGKILMNDWLGGSDKQKEKFIYQIVEQLNIIHSIVFDKYSIFAYQGKKFNNFKNAVSDSIDFSIINKSKLNKTHREDIDFLEEYYQNNIHLLNEEESSVLVHNDIHYGNIFYDGGNITGVLDFDWYCQSSKDYEVWKYVDFVHSPEVFVDPKLESKFKKYDAQLDFNLFKKYYPDLFKNEDLLDRIRLYYLNNLIMLYSETQAGRWDSSVYDEAKERVDNYYRNGWLEKVLYG